VRERRARFRVGLFAIVGLVTVSLGLGAYFGHALRSFELKSVDARFSIRGSQGPPSDVVAVMIDDVTFDTLRVQWPFPRRLHARVIDNIAKGRPAAIAYDVQFTEQTNPVDDNALITSVARAGNLVLAATEVDAKGRSNVFGGQSLLQKIGARAANANLVNDPDGVARHAPYELNKMKSFGVVAAEVASGRPVPRPSSNSQWIDYAGPPGTVKAVSFSSVLHGRVPPSVFRGKVVVVGPSAPSLQDVHATSASGAEWMAGAEIQANAAETALHGFPLRSAPGWWNVGLIILLGLLPPVAGLRIRGWRMLALAVAAGAALALGVQLAFDHGKVVAFTYPLAALALSSVGALVIHYLLEAVERERTRDVFSRFVPEAVVEQVLARAGGGLRLGGESVVGTVIFTDLRGFTSFSEELPAERVIDLLNRYLSTISDAVLAHGGTIVSYLGDGLMAVFGAPLPQADHADRALAAAREMLEQRLPEFNKWLRTEGFDAGFKMGIGLNTGAFMSGNVGSERRLEYTAIGDTINTASRIEGMTKGTPYAMFLADSTREALTTDVDDLVYVDEMAVRGRSQTIRLWSCSSDAFQKPDWESEGGAKAAPPPVVAAGLHPA
jgi:adenylate cyclase